MDIKQLVAISRHVRTKCHLVSILLTVLLLSSNSVFADSVSRQPQFISIGTGDVLGAYYPMGEAICHIANQTRKQHGIRCSSESSSGAISNLEALQQGRLDLAFASQANQRASYFGVDEFSQTTPDLNVRSVMSLHNEPFTIVARADSGINSFEDLPGRRINIGNPGSGHRQLMTQLMSHKGWSHEDFTTITELGSEHQARALCSGQIDAFVFSEGHPSASILEAVNGCNAKIVGLNETFIDHFVSSNASYEAMSIPTIYKGIQTEIATVGTKAVLTASSHTPPDLVYAMVKEVVENFEQIKSIHPSFRNLNTNELIDQNAMLPLHDGARRYFIEAGLIN